MSVDDDFPTVGEDDLTSCCGAYTSISMDDGVEYCKSCFREVLNPGPRFEYKLPEEGE